MAVNKYVQRKYREGKLVAYMYKNGSVVRYKLLKIEKKWLTTTLQVKADYPFRSAEEVNKEIDKLEELVDSTITELLYDNPKLSFNELHKRATDKNFKIISRSAGNMGVELCYCDGKQSVNLLVCNDDERKLWWLERIEY